MYQKNKQRSRLFLAKGRQNRERKQIAREPGIERISCYSLNTYYVPGFAVSAVPRAFISSPDNLMEKGIIPFS